RAESRELRAQPVGEAAALELWLPVPGRVHADVQPVILDAFEVGTRDARVAHVEEGRVNTVRFQLGVVAVVARVDPAGFHFCVSPTNRPSRPTTAANLPDWPSVSTRIAPRIGC